jgi:serine/threonine-protein kinase
LEKIMKPILAFITILTLFSCTGAAWADSFGAISYSPETGATGWSFSYGNRRDAERKAQRSCNENADDCRVAIWFKNGCGAVAVGDDGWGSGWGYSRREARRQAIASCDQRTESCSVVRWQCSGQV